MNAKVALVMAFFTLFMAGLRSQTGSAQADDYELYDEYYIDSGSLNDTELGSGNFVEDMVFNFASHISENINKRCKNKSGEQCKYWRAKQSASAIKSEEIEAELAIPATATDILDNLTGLHVSTSHSESRGRPPEIQESTPTSHQTTQLLHSETSTEAGDDVMTSDICVCPTCLCPQIVCPTVPTVTSPPTTPQCTCWMYHSDSNPMAVCICAASRLFCPVIFCGRDVETLSSNSIPAGNEQNLEVLEKPPCFCTREANKTGGNCSCSCDFANYRCRTADSDRSSSYQEPVHVEDFTAKKDCNVSWLRDAKDAEVPVINCVLPEATLTCDDIRCVAKNNATKSSPLVIPRCECDRIAHTCFCVSLLYKCPVVTCANSTGNDTRSVTTSTTQFPASKSNSSASTSSARLGSPPVQFSDSKTLPSTSKGSAELGIIPEQFSDTETVPSTNSDSTELGSLPVQFPDSKTVPSTSKGSAELGIIPEQFSDTETVLSTNSDSSELGSLPVQFRDSKAVPSTSAASAGLGSLPVSGPMEMHARDRNVRRFKKRRMRFCKP